MSSGPGASRTQVAGEPKATAVRTQSPRRLRVGLVVNPVAGLGGRVGLKGTDGPDVVELARTMGAWPESVPRARRTMSALGQLTADVDLVVYAGAMGETAAQDSGMAFSVIGDLGDSTTTREDTVRATRALIEAHCDLIVFTGGDGTARDVMQGLVQDVPVLGIPAGCKMHSGVFATSPESAARVIAGFARNEGGNLPSRTAEVMDIDEDAFRENRVSAELYGYVRVPYQPRLVQAAKSARSPSEGAALEELAVEFERILSRPGLFLVAGGSTTHYLVTKLGLQKTLLGVDAIADGRIVRADLNESEILELMNGETVWVVVSVIGSQGYIFGRGNQQISPSVIKRSGKDHLVVLATLGKLASLRERRLLVDTGSPDVDRWLSGHMSVHVGYKHQMIMPVGS